jgi:hypothetical protein
MSIIFQCQTLMWMIQHRNHWLLYVILWVCGNFCVCDRSEFWPYYWVSLPLTCKPLILVGFMASGCHLANENACEWELRQGNYEYDSVSLFELLQSATNWNAPIRDKRSFKFQFSVGRGTEPSPSWTRFCSNLRIRRTCLARAFISELLK